MGNFEVYQRTSDGMFNATSLLKQWNNQSVSQRKLDNYFNSDKTQEFVNTIMERENLNTPKMVYLKTRGKYDGGTWMSPLLFFDFAMWINPSFKYDVLKFVYDQMIKYRNDAGDAYRDLSSSIQKIVPTDFMRNAMQKVGEAINWVVFNEHEHGMRNKVGDENKQRELYELEHKVSDLINDGFIKTYEGVINYLRNQYAKHNYPAIFLNKQ
jgi:hypothetical protein